MDLDADVAVVGLGAMGAHAAWRLAARGVGVLGIERFRPGHVNGSSHGATRIFRVACFEHPNLVPLARRSRELFEELAQSSGTSILKLSGVLTIGPGHSDVVRGALDTAAEHDLPVERLGRDELAARFPQHARVGVGHVGVWDAEAGLVFPERAIVAALAAARAAGAEILTDSRVTAVEPVDGGVAIITPTRDFTVGQLVVTAGPWLGSLVPDLPLAPRRTPMTWFAPRPDASESFAIDDFPTFIRAFDDGPSVWGHGSGDGFGVKIGPGHDPNFRLVDPDTIDRSVGAEDWEVVSGVVARAIPGLDPMPTRTTTCMITESPDGQFQIGRLRGKGRVVVGGGGSGHAFKHAAGIGELIAQIVTDEPLMVATDFVDPNRFLGRGTPVVSRARR